MKKRFDVKWNKWIETIQLILDIIIVLFAYYTGFRIQRTELYYSNSFFTAFPQGLREMLIIVGVVALIVFVFFKTFKCGELNRYAIVLNVIFSILLIALLSIFADFAIKGVGIWRQTTAMAMSAELILLLLSKLLFFKIYRKTYKPQKTIIIGKDVGDVGELLLKMMTIEKQKYQIEKVLFEKHGFSHLKDELAGAERLLITAECDEYIKSELVEYCLVNGLECSLIPSIPNITVNSGMLSNIDDVMLLNIKTNMDIEYKLVKRLGDILVSMICLLLLLPLFFIVILLVFFEDKKNPFYTQERVTKGDRIFKMYKFRTMRIDAEKKVGAVISTKDDDRITKTGKFLRKFRIDETPQFINILLGDMSIVGPRPERMELLEKIGADIPEYRYRTVTKAGLTGLAQVSGWYDTSFEKKLKYDLYYVNHCSILLDVKIMFMTASAVINPSIYNEDYSDLKSFEEVFEVLKKHGYIAKKNAYGFCINKEG
jgi:exopolysaccharide biosynthesis polyprenyl glycosylphosphotransferase